MSDAYTHALSLALEQTSPAMLRRVPPLDELYSALESDDSRIALARFCHDMYRGDQLRHLPRLTGESSLEHSRRAHKSFLNVTRVVIDVLSQLYRRPVTRKLSGDDAAAKTIARAFANNPTAQLMLTVDRMTRLQGVCALRVSYQDGEARFWPYPAHRLIVLPDPSQPLTPQCVIAFAASDDARTPLAHVWTSEKIATVANGRVIGEAEHGLGRVPFVFFHDRLPLDGFWVEGRGRSLCHANAEFNAKLSELAYTIAMQGFGVMEIVNPDPTRNIEIGPGRAIAFNVSGNTPYGVDFKSPKAPIAELLADLEFCLRTLLKTQRVPESVLSVNLSTNASGLSILAAQSPVLEDRVERMSLFRSAEQDLVNCTLAVLREHEGLTGQVQVALDFPEPQLEQSLSERMEVDAWKLQQGLTTPWEIMLRDDPDAFTDLEDAKRVWLARRAKMREAGFQPAATAQQA